MSNLGSSSCTGGVDGLEDGGGRKRKCRDGLTSYKEQTDARNRKKVSEDTSSASESDSDKSNSDGDDENNSVNGNGNGKGTGKGHGRGKKDEAATWNEASLAKISASMLNLVGRFLVRRLVGFRIHHEVARIATS